MHQQIPYILAAAQQVHETAKYIPMTANDKASLREAGVVAGIVAGCGVLATLITGRRKPATSK